LLTLIVPKIVDTQAETRIPSVAAILNMPLNVNAPSLPIHAESISAASFILYPASK